VKNVEREAEPRQTQGPANEVQQWSPENAANAQRDRAQSLSTKRFRNPGAAKTFEPPHKAGEQAQMQRQSEWQTAGRGRLFLSKRASHRKKISFSFAVVGLQNRATKIPIYLRVGVECGTPNHLRAHSRPTIGERSPAAASIQTASCAASGWGALRTNSKLCWDQGILRYRHRRPAPAGPHCCLRLWAMVHRNPSAQYNDLAPTAATEHLRDDRRSSREEVCWRQRATPTFPVCIAQYWRSGGKCVAVVPNCRITSATLRARFPVSSVTMSEDAEARASLLV